MVRGEKVILRSVRREDLVQLEREQDSDYDEFNNFGMRADGYLARSFEKDGLLDSTHGTLLVTDLDGQFLGTVSYHQEHYGPGEANRVYNFGITLIPEQRGKGYGVEAQQLLAQYLFATYNIMRVEASTDIENVREQRALEKAGFTRDGVMRKAQWRNGAWHDMVVYSKLRGE